MITTTSTSDAKRIIGLFENINKTLGRDPEQIDTIRDVTIPETNNTSKSPDEYTYRTDVPVSKISEQLPVLDVYNAIRTLESSYSEGAPIDGVLSECREKDISEETVHETIEQL